MQTHIVPVGFDYDRLIAPLIRDQLDVDRVILLEGAVGSEANVEYSRNLSGKLEKDFENLLGAETERVIVDDVYDYDAAFEQAYDLINAELDADDELRGDDDEPGEVWVNVSAMPRPVSFAFATAAHSIMVERQADRERIHTYYTAPRSTSKPNSQRSCGPSAPFSRTSSTPAKSTPTASASASTPPPTCCRSSTSAGRPSARSR